MKILPRLISSIFYFLILTTLILINLIFDSIGSYIGASLYIILSIWGVYEILLIFKVNIINAFCTSIFMILFFILPFENFKSVASLKSEIFTFQQKDFANDYESNIELLLNIKSFLILFFASFLPLIFDFKYFKKHFFKNWIFIFSILCIVGASFKILWAINQVNIFGISFFILIAIISDTTSFFGGYALGNIKFLKTKPFPFISPNKTLIGFIIGYIFTFIFAFLGGYYLQIWTHHPNSWLWSFLFASMIAFIPPMGDLFFSLIKRLQNVKDFSNIVPGHGGLFDRVDSLSFVACFASIIFCWM